MLHLPCHISLMDLRCFLNPLPLEASVIQMNVIAIFLRPAVDRLTTGSPPKLHHFLPVPAGGIHTFTLPKLATFLVQFLLTVLVNLRHPDSAAFRILLILPPIRIFSIYDLSSFRISLKNIFLPLLITPGAIFPERPCSYHEIKMMISRFPMNSTVETHPLFREYPRHIIEKCLCLRRSKDIRNRQIELSCKSGIRRLLDLLHRIPELRVISELDRSIFT